MRLWQTLVVLGPLSAAFAGLLAVGRSDSLGSPAASVRAIRPASVQPRQGKEEEGRRHEAEPLSPGVRHGDQARTASAPPAPPAGSATLYRDTYGVPHVFGTDLRAAFYGLGYAHAQDNDGEQRLIKRVEGRLAEVLGPGPGNRNVDQDVDLRHYRFFEDAMARYPELDPVTRRILEAYAAGVNRYLEDHRDRLPPWWQPARPEHFVAHVLAAEFLGPNGTAAQALGSLQPPLRLSNALALGESRVEGGGTIVYGDPHTSWGGNSGQQAHVSCPAGEAAGAWAGPYFHHGFGDGVSWTSTTNWPSPVTVYREKLNPSNPAQYWDARGSGGWADMERRVIRVKVRNPGSGSPTQVRVAGMSGSSPEFFVHEETRYFTHHGPVLRLGTDAQGNPGYFAWSVKVASWGRVQVVAEFVHMMLQEDVESFRANLLGHEQNNVNRTYGDRRGQVRYLWNGRVFHRDEGLDWTRWVRGDRANTEWSPELWGTPGAPPLPEISRQPQGGYAYNCNDAPWFSANPREIRADGWPGFVVPTSSWGSVQTPRGWRLERLVDGREKLTVEDVRRIAADVHVPAGAALMRSYRGGMERNPWFRAQLAEEEGTVADELAGWAEDGTASADSTGFTLLFHWVRALALQRNAAGGPGVTQEPWPFARLQGAGILPRTGEAATAGQLQLHGLLLTRVVAAMGKYYGGDLLVPWGRIHLAKRGGRTFSCAGGTGLLCSLWPMAPDLEGPGVEQVNPDGTVDVVKGSHNVWVVRLNGAVTEAWTISVGQSDDPRSPHSADQMELLTRDLTLRPFWLREDEVREHLCPYGEDPAHEHRQVTRLEVR